MTIGIKTSSAAYLKLLMDFLPRPIQDDVMLQATQQRINHLLDGQVSEDVRDYLHVLGMLVYEYEEKTEAMPQLSPEERTRALALED